MFLLSFVITRLNSSQEEGTATASFVSESLQMVDPEKMTIEDEEAFMEVAMQMYSGMLSDLQSLYPCHLSSLV
jgi:hypothetical protein